jgi:hypothetical protein
MKTTWFRSGQWNAVCDVCGNNFKNTQLIKRWDGLMVCKDDWEIRHPQDLIRPIPSGPGLPWSRPVGSEEFVEFSTIAPQACSVLGIYSMAGIGTAGCAQAGTFLNRLL